MTSHTHPCLVTRPSECEEKDTILGIFIGDADHRYYKDKAGYLFEPSADAIDVFLRRHEILEWRVMRLACKIVPPA